MPQRIQPGGIPLPKIVRPGAAVADTYVAPQRDSDSEQLASALSELVPSLSRFTGVLGQQKNAKLKEEGEAAAREMAASGRTLAQEVRDGTRRPEDNPWFKVGFYETAGRTAGGKYIGDFLEALNNSPVAEATELSAFDKFERKFREQYVTSTLGENVDPFLANAFGSTADGQMQGIRNAFAQQAGDRMVKFNTENFHSEVFQLAERFAATDLSTSERGALIVQAQERQVATGSMTYARVNLVTARAIAAAAVRNRDVGMLDLIDQVPTDARSRGFLGQTSYGAKIREEAEDAISRAVDSDVRREAAVAKRNRDRSIQTITGGLVDALTADPGADISTMISEMRNVDPTYIPTLLGMRDTIAKGVYADDPNVVRSLAIGIDTRAPGQDGYTTLRDLDEAFAAQNLTFDTYRTLKADIQKRDEAGGSGKFLRNPILTDIESETRRIFVSEYPDGMTTPAIRANAQAAADEAVMEMLQWLKRNPDADPDAILAQKASIRTRIVRSRVGLQALPEKESASQTAAVSAVKPAGFLLPSALLVGQMQREYAEIKRGERNGFSSQFRDTFAKNKIDPTDMEAVQKFLTTNLQWIDSSTPKP